MNERESKGDPAEIKESLDDLVQKLDPGKKSSSSWSESMDENKEEWERLKRKIRERQSALKELVTAMKAGLISRDEFQERYPKLQDELSELEEAVYNLRLGTHVK
ncbi:MAG: hypothetical protein ACFFEV_06810 [Candidatus Thorarchaeota archaeon]